MSFGVDLAAAGVRVAQMQARQARDDQRENTTREVRNSFSFTTTGCGTFVSPAAIVFDALFIQEPHFTSGVAMVKSADLNLYDLPTGQAAVYRWVKRPIQEHKDANAIAFGVGASAGKSAYLPRIVSEPDDREPMYYTGCYLYFVVKADIKSRLSTALKTQAASQPPSATLHHHVTFTGTAMKDLPKSIMRLQFDKAITANPTPLGAGDG